MKRTLFIIATVAIIFTIGYKEVKAGRADYEARSLSLFRASDLFVRNQVVLLESDQGGCTGVQVIGPSGHVYTLTASHCKPLLIGDKMKAITESGITYLVSLIAEDPSSDLLLLSSDSPTGVFVANEIFQHQKVHTLTHGHRMPTYRTDGELLDVQKVAVVLFDANESNVQQCSNMPKLQLVGVPGLGMYCMMETYQMMATAGIIPGSSGGPLLDASGNLVGIASATNGSFSAFVTLSDIKTFLKDY